MKKLLFLFLPLFLYAQSGELLRVIDGDTLLLKDESGFTICQMSFIDTPEAIENEKLLKDIQPCSNITKEYALSAGKEAKEFVGSLLKKSQILEYETTRILANNNPVCQIRIPKGTQVKLKPILSEVMVEQGYALPFVVYAEEQKEELMLDLAKNAKEEKRGLWKSHPDLMRCLVYQRYSLRSLRD